MPTVAVTGTNGKTTVTHLIEHVLAHCGQRPALLGTIAMRGPAGDSPAELTTPEADAIARFARTQRDAGATHLVMEASSHALDLGRMRGVALEVAAFTNLTQDHLDYHGSMEAYGRAKARLFTDCAPRHSVIMVDSDFGRELARAARGRVHGASVGPVPEAACCVRSFRSSRAGIAALVQTPDGELRLDSPLFGAHNVENLLVALGVARALGLEGPAIAEALRTAHGAQGRMERVEDPRGVLVLVDYAHTPDALVRALEAVRPLTPGRLFVVCGCGGDRDTQKRAPMGAAAARLADIAVLTSDNPRTEDPLTILAELERGARGAGAEVFPLRDLGPSTRRGCAVEPRRDAAIGHVLAAVKPGDTVLIAGKGHETYQIVGETRWPFDDRDVARRAIAACVGG